MSEFEFSTVLVSVVLAIAIAEILATWGRMIRRRQHVRPYWVHVGWMALMLLLAIENWVGFWSFRGRPGWSFFEYVLMLIPSLALVVLTFVLCPDLSTERSENLEQYFYQNSSWIFGLASIYLVSLMVTYSLLRGDPWVGPLNLIRVVALSAVLTLSVTKSRKVHGAALTACFGLFVIFVFLETMGG